VVVGDGVERERLQAQACTLGVAERVSFAGAVPNEQLLRWYSAADALILASSREGWANVLLEAMACGTPVVATRIWGTPEVVTPESGGVLFEPREGSALAAAVQQLLRSQPERSRVRRYAEGFSWQQTTQAQVDLFARLSGRQPETA
jgi:glycosyltransferase involved in cell wall biosynthesis